MEVKYYLPRFEEHTTTVKKDAKTELFRRLYKEKSAHMDQVKVLNFYGGAGAGISHLMRALYNVIENAENKTKEKPETPSAAAKTMQPAAIYCNILPGGIPIVISQIIKNSRALGFAFPLTSLCLYIFSRASDEECANAFLLSELKKAAAYLETEPEFQYLKQVLDPAPVEQNWSILLYNELLLDDRAPRSLHHLAKTNPGSLKYLLSGPVSDLSLHYKHDVLSAMAEQRRKNELNNIAFFFTSYFAADMEKNLKDYSAPFVMLLDRIDNMFSRAVTAAGQRETEKWLCGTSGLLTTVPKVLWVLSSRKKLNWDKDYLPDWKSALTQKAIPAPRTPGRRNIAIRPEGIVADIWAQQKDTLDEKVQCVLQGLGIFKFALALNACTYLIEEFRDIPEFETACRNSIYRFYDKVLAPRPSRGNIPYKRPIADYFCYAPETENTDTSIKYKFKAFYYAQKFYAALINHAAFRPSALGKPLQSEQKIRIKELPRQIQTVESLIDSTKQFVSGNNSVQRRLLAFYFMAVTPQVLDWIDLGLYSVAEGILEKLKAVIAEDHPLLSGAYELCYAYLQKVRDNNTAEAIQRMEAIYKDVKETLGKEDPAVVYLLNILGYVRGFMPGQEVTAYRERRQCVRILQNTLGKTAKETIRTISLLSPHLADTGRKEASELVSKICLAKAEYLFGENDLVTLQCKARYAFRLKAKRNYREAADLQEAVANQYEAIYGNHNPKTLTALKALANTLYSLGNETELDEENETVITDYAAKEKELRLREAVLKHYQSILQNEQTEKNATVHPFIRDAVINVCDSMYNCNRPLEEIIEFAKKHLGANDPGLISVLHNAAIDDSENGESERAVTMIKQAIELRKKLGIETYAGLKSYIACRVSLAWFYAETGTAEEQDGEPNLFIAIPKDCETLLAMAEKDNNPDLIDESKLFTANRLYNLAHIALYFYSEHELALELIEKAISLKLSVSDAKDEELMDYLELKRDIENI